jgi:hypothetical protein
MTTEAGKRLLGFIDAAIENTTNGVSWRNGAGYARVCAEGSIPAIEAEAVAAERARLRAAVQEVEGHPHAETGGKGRYWIDRAAVLAIIENTP